MTRYERFNARTWRRSDHIAICVLCTCIALILGFLGYCALTALSLWSLPLLTTALLSFVSAIHHLCESLTP